MTMHETHNDNADLSGVKRGYVLVGALLFGVIVMGVSSFNQGEPIWRGFADRHALLYAGHEDPERFGATAGGEQDTEPDASPDETPVLPHWSDPSNSLATFFSALNNGQEEESGVVRAMFYGTSEIGFDRVTSQIRRRMQARFGDGGKGFVVIAPGWRYQRHRDIDWRVDGNWDVFSVRAGRREDGRYGLGGVLAVNQGPAWVEYHTLSADPERDQDYFDFLAGSRWSRLELYYQGFPTAGTVTIDVDEETHLVATATDELRDDVFAVETVDGPHRTRITTAEPETRLYGVTLERSSGFVLDALMIIGAWGHTHLNYDEAHLERQVELRWPDLVIFQLGAKEVFRNPDLTDEEAREFVNQYTLTVERTLAGRPGTSCLIVSMKDMGARERNRVITRPAVHKIVAGSEEVARNTGCAFFDIFAAMGGDGTMERWSKHEPRLVSPDLGHLMRPGAIAVGDIITDALLTAYEAHTETAP
jgi:hypothetical protein